MEARENGGLPSTESCGLARLARPPETGWASRVAFHHCTSVDFPSYLGTTRAAMAASDVDTDDPYESPDESRIKERLASRGTPWAPRRPTSRATSLRRNQQHHLRLESYIYTLRSPLRQGVLALYKMRDAKHSKPWQARHAGVAAYLVCKNACRSANAPDEYRQLVALIERLAQRGRGYEALERVYYALDSCEIASVLRSMRCPIHLQLW